MAVPQEIRDAVQTVEARGEQIRAELAIIDYVKDVDALDRAAGEADTRRAQAVKAATEAQGQLDVVNGKLTQARADREQVRTDIASLQTQARTIVGSAKTEAEGILAAARSDGEKLRQQGEADAQAAIDAKRDELAGVNADIQKAQAHLDDLNSQAADAEAKRRQAVDFLASLTTKAGS